MSKSMKRYRSIYWFLLCAMRRLIQQHLIKAGITVSVLEKQARGSRGQQHAQGHTAGKRGARLLPFYILKENQSGCTTLSLMAHECPVCVRVRVRTYVCPRGRLGAGPAAAAGRGGSSAAHGGGMSLSSQPSERTTVS